MGVVSLRLTSVWSPSGRLNCDRSTFFARRGVQDRLDVGRQDACDQADAQAVDLQGVADLGRDHLLVG